MDSAFAPTTREWVLLNHRLPREPSTPRIAVWRKLKQLGVAQLADGLVALPADARTREQIDWIAEEVREAGGAASVWLARPTTLDQERAIAQVMADDRATEYAALEARAHEAETYDPARRARAVRQLRNDLRRVRRRDFFPSTARDTAIAAVERLARIGSDETALEVGQSSGSRMGEDR